MSTNISLEGIFPQESDVPEEYSISDPIHFRNYLIDGEICCWEGEVN